jgi:ABC-type branched-subunit amino acid transport system substrate-binding protein
MDHWGRAAAIVAALLLVAGACTSDPDEAGGGGDGGADQSGPGPTTGLTDDTIRIGFIGADFGALAEAGLAPDLGDQPKIVQSVVDEINEGGGIGGRQVEVRVTLVDGTAGPEVGQAACLEMTQDFQAFAVIVAPAVTREVARCAAVTNETLTLGATGFDEAMYEESGGRLFTLGSATSMSTDRQYAGWARIMDEQGLLDGATIGVITAEANPEFVTAAADALVPALEALGHQVAENVTLPCPEGDIDCDQQEAAVQRLKDANVDFVFMAAANTVGPTVVQAATNLDFHPQWAANGNQVTDTVASFFESVKAEWDGAIGTSTVFAEPEDLTDAARGCNDVIATRSGERYEPGSDAFGFAAVNCLLFQALDQTGDGLEGDALGQASMVAALEGLGSVVLNAGPDGSISADKHNAGDHLFLADYRADVGEFVQRDGEPVEVE